LQKVSDAGIFCLHLGTKLLNQLRKKRMDMITSEVAGFQYNILKYNEIKLYFR